MGNSKFFGILVLSCALVSTHAIGDGAQLIKRAADLTAAVTKELKNCVCTQTSTVNACVTCEKVAGQGTAGVTAGGRTTGVNAQFSLFLKASADGSAVSTAIDGNEGQARITIKGSAEAGEINLNPSVDGVELNCCNDLFNAGTITFNAPNLTSKLTITGEFRGDGQISGGWVVAGGSGEGSITRNYSATKTLGSFTINLAGKTAAQASAEADAMAKAIGDSLTKSVSDELVRQIGADAYNLSLTIKTAANQIKKVTKSVTAEVKREAVKQTYGWSGAIMSAASKAAKVMEKCIIITGPGLLGASAGVKLAPGLAPVCSSTTTRPATTTTRVSPTSTTVRPTTTTRRITTTTMRPTTTTRLNTTTTTRRQTTTTRAPITTTTRPSLTTRVLAP